MTFNSLTKSWVHGVAMLCISDLYAIGDNVIDVLDDDMEFSAPGD